MRRLLSIGVVCGLLLPLAGGNAVASGLSQNPELFLNILPAGQQVVQVTAHR
jgi:hypothetical protein